jgi:predicted phage tail protein
MAPLAGHYSHTICTVHLHGSLREKFGDSIRVPASTVAGALRGMLALKPGMVNVLEHGSYHIIRGSLDGGLDLDESQLALNLGPSKEIHLFPSAQGGGGGHGGGLKIVLGAVLIIASVALAATGVGAPVAAALDTTLGTTLTGAGLEGALLLAGASLLLQGISRLISPQPGLGASYLLNGNTNTVGQGTPVPLVYGTTRVGSILVGSSYSAEDYSTATSDYQGSAAYVNSAGGYSGTLDAFDTGNPLPSGASGKGGGGGKSGGGGVEAPNTLESKAIVSLIDIFSEGPVGGLVNGAQSIFFNNTPLQNADGTFNFRGVKWFYLFGTPTQQPIPGFPSATDTIQVNSEVFYGTPVIQQLQSTTATQARVTIELPALYATNTQNGDVNPSMVGLIIAVAQVSGGTTGAYSTAVQDNISGKATAPYQRSYVFDLPGSGVGGTTSAWNVRITKTTAESAVSSTINQLFWSGYDLIANYSLSYPDSAGILLQIDSEAFGSTLPARSYLVAGIEVQVPANYNAVTRTYATSGNGTAGGSWDFVTFGSAVTSNPAWILYDFLSSKRYGLGLSAQQLEFSLIQLYPIAQYCDGLVPDGYTATEPRYQLNGVFSQRANAFQLMQAIAGTFRGQVYWAGGQVAVTADMPQNPVKIYTAANVIGGNFVYNGTSLKTRHTTCNLHFVDPSNQYLPAVEITELPQQVAQRGIFAADVLGFGVTSRGLAHRLGNWLLYTENFQTEIVTFSVAWDSVGVFPGNLIQIADVNIAGIRMGGRLRSFSTASLLCLDMVFTPTPGQTYTMTVVLEDGTLAQGVTVSEFVLQNFTTPANMDEANGAQYTQAVLSSALSSTPLPGAIYVIQDATVPLTEWQVVGITETSRGVFEIVAMQYNPAKYSLIETVPTLNIPSFSGTNSGLVAPLPPPTNVTSNTTLAGQGLTTIISTTISWTVPVDIRIVQYQVSVVNAEAVTIAVLTATGSSVVVENLPPDTYYYSVRSLGSNGSTSTWAYSSPSVITGTSNNTPPSVVGLTASSGNRQVFLQWVASVQQDVYQYLVWRSSSTVAPHQPGSLAALIGTISATSFSDVDAQTLTPGTTWNYWVQAITTTGVIGGLSVPASALITYVYGSDIATGAIAAIDQFAATISPVVVWTGASLPANPAAVGGGTLLFWLVTTQLYTWTGSAWSNAVNTSQLVGTIQGSTVSGVLSGATVPGSVVTGTVAAASTVPAAGVSGLLTAAQIGSVNSSAISGNITNAQIAGVNASKVTGTLTSSQIASVAAATVTGTLALAQIPAIPASQISGTIAAAQIAGLASSQITGTLTASQIASVNAAAVAGTLVGSQIAAGTITASNIAASTITAAQIAAGTITAAQIAAGTIQASNIAAGAITTATLAVGSSNNLIWNSCSTLTTAGWINSYGTDGFANGTYSSVPSTSPYYMGIGALQLSGVAYATNNYYDLCWGPSSSVSNGYYAQTPVVPGQTYEFQGKFIASVAGVTVQVFLLFEDSSGNTTNNFASTNTAISSTSPPKTFADWTQVGVIAQAPANSAVVGLLLRFGNASGGTLSFNVYMTQALFGQTVPNATQFSQWSPGGVTQINGGMVQANSITANQIAASTITGTNIAGGTITGGNIAAGTIVAGNIAASTITAAQIAAGTITAAQIAAGTIQASNIAAGAITAAALSVGSPSNQIWNSCSTLTDAGWTYAGSYTNGGAVQGSTYAATWLLPGGSGYLFGASIASGGNMNVNWGTNFPVLAGQWYGAQALIACQNLGYGVLVKILWLDSSGTQLSVSNGNLIAAGATSGLTIANYGTSYLIAQAPVGAVSATFRIQCQAGSSAVTNALLIYSQTTFGQVASGSVTGPLVWAPGGATQINGGMIQANSITANQIAANTITAGQLAANSVSTGALDVGFGTNVISNPSCQVSTYGWSYSSSGTVTAGQFIQAGSGSYSPPEGAGELFATSVSNGSFMSATWSPSLARSGVNGVACTPGTWLEAQAKLGATRGYAQVAILYYTASGAFLFSVLGNKVYSSPGTSLSAFTLSSVINQVPTGAATAAISIIGGNDGSASIQGGTAGSNLGAFFCQASLGLTVANALEVMPYTPGGITSINGGMIETNSVTANQIAAGTITTTQLAAGTLTASNITAGSLNAGIVLSSLANFGTIQVTSAQIANLTVGTSNIAYGAVTSTGSLALTTENGNGSTASGTYTGNINITLPANSYVIFYVKGIGSNFYGPATAQEPGAGDGGGDVTITYTPNQLEYQVSRSGTVLANGIVIGTGNSGLLIGTRSSFDQPGTGTYTYVLSMTIYPSSQTSGATIGFQAQLAYMIVQK